MSLARTPDGREYTAPGFDYDAHDRWVRAGHCPVVSLSKAWCGKMNDHEEFLHGSPWLDPDFRGPHYAEWAW